jgi:hypothetical protein
MKWMYFIIKGGFVWSTILMGVLSTGFYSLKKNVNTGPYF